MKKFNKFFIALMSAGILASCSSDNLDGPKTPENVDGLYMTLTVSPQSMTRTASPSNIFEEGTEDENKVNNLLLILVDKNNIVIDYARVSATNTNTGKVDVSADNKTVTATGQFNRNNMISYLQTNPADNETKFYVVCNPTEAQEFTIGQNINDFICKKSLSTYSTPNNFVMSNSKNADVSLPTLNDVRAGKYSSIEDSYKIATVEVERVVARFDYAEYIDGSEAKGSAGNYYFELSSAREDDTNGKLNISIKQLALANMGKAFFLFKRVNSDGHLTTLAAMFGAETKDNYVVGPYGKEKAALNSIEDDGDKFDKYFEYAIFGKNFQPQFDNVSAIMNSANIRGDEDGKKDTGKGYNFWRYSMPNNLPADPKVTQKNGNSTVVIFRAEITTPDTEGDLKTAMKAGNDIYAHNGKLIGNYTALKELIAKDAAHAISIAYNNSGLTDTQKEATTADQEINKSLVKNGKFAIYSADNGHYYCDYYYWNRHNDNNDLNLMGPMEFAVVRNTIYKLAVTKIAKLGHPTIKENDPDPLKPDTPDETSDFFMNVSVTIRNWGVRVNNIEF